MVSTGSPHPFRKWEGIEVRGFPARHRYEKETLSLPCPLGMGEVEDGAKQVRFFQG